MKNTVRLMAVLGSALLAGTVVAADRSSRLIDQFPLGVFWPWEKNAANAEVAGLTTTNYVERMVGLLKEMNCDTVWFVHGPGARNAAWFMPMMERYGIKGMVASDMIDLYYSGGVAKGCDYVAQQAEKTVRAFSPYASLLGYVLKDEPIQCDVQHTDYFYEVMRKADPAHDAAVISMTHHNQLYLEDTRLPVICTDIYHFGGDGSRYIPSPAEVSRRSFRATAHAAVTAAERNGKHVWIMPMAFSDVWGPNYWDKEGRHWALPGSYFHWRMPTVAESRWQVWEAIRCGAKGVLVYLLNYKPFPTEEEMRTLGSPWHERCFSDKRLEKVIERFGSKAVSQEKREVDPAWALTFPGGEPTPQFKAIGQAFGAIAPQRSLLLNARRANFPVFFPDDSDVKAQTFMRDGDSARLGVLVSDDIEKTRMVRIRVAKNVSRVLDLNGGELALSDDPTGPFKSFEIALEAGGGALLAASFADGQAGFPLLREDFSNGRTKGSVGENAEQSRNFSFNNGADWQLRLRKDADATKPAFTLSNLTNAKSANNTVFMNLNRKKENGTVFLDLSGTLKAAEVTVVLDAAAAAKETDIMHTGVDEKAKDSDAAARRVIWKAGDPLPVAVPVGATGLEFRLGASDSLAEIFLWFVPKTVK